MKLKNLLGIALILITNAIYAADADTDTDVSMPVTTPAVSKGAQQYDWQTCVDQKAGTCLDSCGLSGNPDCSDNCKTLARDKCTTEGLAPP